jgi:hypothetical protein
LKCLSYKKAQFLLENAKANQVHHKVQNILNRKFNHTILRKVLLTDITYMENKVKQIKGAT